MPGEGLYTNPQRGLGVRPQAQNRRIGGGNTSALAQLLASARNRGGQSQGRQQAGRGNPNASAIAQLLARARNQGGQGGLGARQQGLSPQIQQLMRRLRGARG